MSTRIVPGAEPFRFEGGPDGALLLHGFTGSPASMRPMGRFLADHGMTVVGPRLPGHGTSVEDLAGTTWQDWEREAEAALAELTAKCQNVTVAGLSMGGGLAIHLAAKHPERLQGVVAINSYIHDPRLAFAPIGRLFMRTRPGVVNDIKKPGQDEVGYPRVPLAALPSLAKLLKTVVADLPSVTAPLLVFSSLEDHVAKPANSALVMQRAGSAQKDMVRLANSYHVATLDYDAEEIFQRTLDFAKATART
ncbi:MAG TPA: alpha/beta fold hydrolase [Actinomycetota bacterium]|nr:alpha/beta fold hydrolase [Actinomycetota bacterium]